MEKKEKTIYEKLLFVQNELKAPKDKRNNFGGYNYRSCEGILETENKENGKNTDTIASGKN